MNLPTQAEIEHHLAIVTVVMSIAIPALHGTRAVVRRLRAYALTTPERWDEDVLDRLLRVLGWLDALVMSVSSVLPRPPSELMQRTPAIERVEGDDPQ